MKIRTINNNLISFMFVDNIIYMYMICNKFTIREMNND